MKIELDESQRQMTLCALGHLALLRPGWDYALGKIADRLDGRRMYETFKTANADRTPPQDLWIHDRADYGE